MLLSTAHHTPIGIQALPVELLSRIFVQGSALDDPYSESPFLLKPDQDYYPTAFSNLQVTVSHVCRHWRQVALRTQSLWKTLHFRERAHIERAKAYIARCSLSTTYSFDILVDTVSKEDHTGGITLYTEELRNIFQLIIPLVDRWRAFHLKICDNDCKAIAREFLGACGPAPHLETLQLYHFEDYRTTQRLYMATYRPPVVVFNNTLPRLKNVSLIGVNLPWDQSPYLQNLRHLELALHLDSVRPPYEWWDRMLRLSPDLKNLYLRYSGPKLPSAESSLTWRNVDDKIHLIELEELSLIDLDPDYLCDLVQRLVVPAVSKLTLNLPEQDFSPFIDLLSNSTPNHPDGCAVDGSSTFDVNRSDFAPIPPPMFPANVQFNLWRVKDMCIRGLECDEVTWARFVHHLQGLETLEMDFSRVSLDFWKSLIDEKPLSAQFPFGGNHTATDCTQLLPNLRTFKVSGVCGKELRRGICRRYEAYSQGRAALVRWVVRWSEQCRGRDLDLDDLVDSGIRICGEYVTVGTIDWEDDTGDDTDIEDVDTDCD